MPAENEEGVALIFFESKDPQLMSVQDAGGAHTSCSVLRREANGSASDSLYNSFLKQPPPTATTLAAGCSMQMHKSSSFSRAASQTFLVSKLSFTLLKYLGIGYRWTNKFGALALYALFLTPGFLQDLTQLHMANNNVLALPTYDDIFCPPKKCVREPGKLYGKKLLEIRFKEQHNILLENYRSVRGWFKNISSPNDLRHKEEEKEKLWEIIRNNHSSIKPLQFGGTGYTWKEKHIYSWWVASCQSRRKYANKIKSSSTQMLSESENETLDISKMKEECKNGDNEKEIFEPTLVQKDVDLSIEDTPIDSQEALEKVNIHDASNEDDITSSPLLDKRNIEEELLRIEREKLYLLWKASEMREHTPYHQDSYFEELYEDVLNGSQFPCGFTTLLESGSHGKRIRASPNTHSTMSVNPTNEKENKVVVESSHCKPSNELRKSVRERKISEKLKSVIEKKSEKVRSFTKTKKLKSIKDKEDDREKDLVIEKTNPNDNSLSSEDKDTILLKYFDLETVEDMYMVLKASYYKIKKGEKFFKEDEKKLTLLEMRDNLVDWLFSCGKVTLSRQEGHDLTLDEVEILM